MTVQTKTLARERIAKLRAEIERHRYLYHVLDKQEISDVALDSLKHELEELEQQFPDLRTRDSPTQRVGGAPRPEFTKVQHRTPMLSLTDVFTSEEFGSWVERNRKLDPRADHGFYAELKLDGLALSLVYDDGILKTAATRGDGFIGEEVTENVRTIESVPLKLRIDALPLTVRSRARERVEVRGEAYMRKVDFDALNRAQRKRGLPEFANPRNVSAGSIRQLDPKITASRKLRFAAYDLTSDLGQRTHEEAHALASTLGFPVTPRSRICPTVADVEEYHTEIGKVRAKLPFWSDGIVVNLNTLTLVQKLGVVGKAPRGAVAYKYPAKEATTVVDAVTVQIGRTGAVTPVAHLQPVLLAGTTVARATLHNADELARLDVRVGDTVVVKKAGEIIPDVVRVLTRLRPRGTKPFRFPTVCPVCKTRLVRPGTEVVHRCPNPNCPARKREGLYHFASRRALDIEGLGRETVDVLVDEGLVREPADLFRLEPSKLVGLPLVAEMKAQNLVNAVAARRTVPLARFLYALGIRHVGEETAIAVARSFGTLDGVRSATVEELETVPDVGPVVAKSIAMFFADPEHRRQVDHLLRFVRVTGETKPRHTPLFGRTYVVTGTLESMTREDAQTRLRALGAQVSSSVSKRTTGVVVGENPGSKYERAKALGVPILSETDFLKLLKANEK